jgi:hypothetical protein
MYQGQMEAQTAAAEAKFERKMALRERLHQQQRGQQMEEQHQRYQVHKFDDDFLK